MYGADPVCDHHTHAADRLRHHDRALRHPTPDPSLDGRPDRLCGAVPRRPRRLRRERGPAVDAGRPRALGGRTAVGDQRLRDRLRRVHAARRAGRRPLRAQGDVPARARALHRRLRRGRPRSGGLAARRGPRGPGPRRGRPLPGHADPGHRSCHGRSGQDPGHRHLDGGGRGRRRRGRLRRRAPRRPALLALGPPRQRAHRGPRPGGRDALAPRAAPPPAAASTCRAPSSSPRASPPSRTASCRPRRPAGATRRPS